MASDRGDCGPGRRRYRRPRSGGDPKEIAGSEDTTRKIRDYATDAKDRESRLLTHRRLVEAVHAPSLSPGDVRRLMGLRAGEATRGPLWDLSVILQGGG
ncbi:MAG: hypothetical protein ACRDQZ_18400 [Mycobacteriales bacterium]